MVRSNAGNGTVLAYDAILQSGTNHRGTLRISDGVGWLGMATTLPSHRRRGAQEALLANRINDGRRMGCLWFVSETTEDTPQRPNPSFHNMIRAGFRLAYQRPNYMRLR